MSKSEKANEPQPKMEIRHCLIWVIVGGDDSKGDKKELVLSFSTSGEKQSWMQALLKCIVTSLKVNREKREEKRSERESHTLW